MKTKFALASVFVIAFSIHSAAFAAQPTAQDKADAANINSACAQDAATTGCSGMVVGKGLLKCMHKYKEENKSYKFSPGCKAAMKELKSDKESGK
ncbi:MAG TPA: hypothetical protein VKG67_02205 [Gallionellaceae bacterium]|nr:hypothetical protein [Gallionellaceae bacterium]